MESRVGYRFYPDDEEHINEFLIPKVLGMDLQHIREAVGEVQVLKLEPWDLPALSVIESTDPYWYFFYKLDYKCKRARRTTEAGYWKATGKERKVWRRETQQQIGTKKTLTFYKGRCSTGRKTNWVLHEYRLAPEIPNPEASVICRLKREADATASVIAEESESTGQSPPDLSGHVVDNSVPEAGPGPIIGSGGQGSSSSDWNGDLTQFETSISGPPSTAILERNSVGRDLKMSIYPFWNGQSWQYVY